MFRRFLINILFVHLEKQRIFRVHLSICRAIVQLNHNCASTDFAAQHLRDIHGNGDSMLCALVNSMRESKWEKPQSWVEIWWERTSAYVWMCACCMHGRKTLGKFNGIGVVVFSACLLCVYAHGKRMLWNHRIEWNGRHKCSGRVTFGESDWLGKLQFLSWIALEEGLFYRHAQWAHKKFFVAYDFIWIDVVIQLPCKRNFSEFISENLYFFGNSC